MSAMQAPVWTPESKGTVTNLGMAKSIVDVHAIVFCVLTPDDYTTSRNCQSIFPNESNAICGGPTNSNH